MEDPRVARLGELIVGYSLDLREGQIVRIDGSEHAAPLVLALYRAALARGALPYTNIALDGLAERLVADGTEDQIGYISAVERKEAELIDALVVIRSGANARSFGHADVLRHRRYITARRELTRAFMNRVTSGEATWCGLQFPDHAHAQEAEMSLREYEEFVYGACHVLGDEDPIEHWRAAATALRARADELAETCELRVLGPDTDLRLTVEGRGWRTGEGRRNMPDGEVFTSPVEEATEGEIRFTVPSVYGNREVEDVRLRFEGGRVVHAEAARGEDHLRSLLELDEDASLLGEFAFGLNYGIDRFTRNTLFDEKIGGTVHAALGSGFPEVGGRKRSALHWDLVCDLREEGEVHADGELIWQAGRFLHEPSSSGRPAEPAAAR